MKLIVVQFERDESDAGRTPGYSREIPHPAEVRPVSGRRLQKNPRIQTWPTLTHYTHNGAICARRCRAERTDPTNLLEIICRGLDRDGDCRSRIRVNAVSGTAGGRHHGSCHRRQTSLRAGGKFDLAHLPVRQRRTPFCWTPARSFRRCLVSARLLPMPPATPSTSFQRRLATNCFMSSFIRPRWGSMFAGPALGRATIPPKIFSYDEGDPDPEMKRFSIAHDRANVLPMLRLARKANPDLFLFSSPWSPPGWMKAGGSMLGGSIRQRYFGPYAQYFLKFLRDYAAEGVPVQAVTVQNEVDTDQDGRMPACLFPQEYEIGFVKNHLGPLLQQNSISTKIWILDHNYNLWGRAICELDDEDLRKYCNAVAFHGYVGTPEMMDKVHEAHPDAQLYWTEGGPDYTAHPTMQRIGRTGERRSRRRLATGARRLVDGIWRWMKKAGRTSGRFPAAAWSRSIRKQRRSRAVVSTGRLHISRATCGEGRRDSTPLARWTGRGASCFRESRRAESSCRDELGHRENRNSQTGE